MISLDQAEKIAESVANTKEGGFLHKEAIEIEAAHRGVSPETINRYLRMARIGDKLTPVIITRNYHISYPASPTAYEGTTRVCAIGDAHDHPRIKQDRFKWIGKHIRGTRVESVIQIGDFGTFDSLCKYDDNSSWLGKHKPTFEEDITSLKNALEHIQYQIEDRDYIVDKHITLGNHEDRVESFANRNPEIYGMMISALHKTFDDFGWTYSPYGQLYNIAGVDFVHVPLNKMGRPYSSPQNIARDAVRDIVYGHNHEGGTYTAPKIGGQGIQVLNLACALPDGHVERYAKHTATGWRYGIYDLWLRNGRIDAWRFYSMQEMEEKYG